AWFYYGETRLGQGRDNVKIILADNPDLANEIEAKIFAAANVNGAEAVAEEAHSAPAPVEEAPKTRRKINIDVAVDE
ncbi:MAG: DNA recombination/repair protein RecA, partial [Clostridia bacterium]|nr:DNA recombination/repair protein RecA [Clostridia bacterium]